MNERRCRWIGFTDDQEIELIADLVQKLGLAVAKRDCGGAQRAAADLHFICCQLDGERARVAVNKIAEACAK